MSEQDSKPNLLVNSGVLREANGLLKDEARNSEVESDDTTQDRAPENHKSSGKTDNEEAESGESIANDESPGDEADSNVSSSTQEASSADNELGSEEEEEEIEAEEFENDVQPTYASNAVINEEELPKTCTVLKTSNGEGVVYLVGTAHFSKESANDVTTVIRKVKPTTLVLELCAGRTDILRLDEETLLREVKDLSFNKVMSFIRKFGKVHGLMYVLMLSMSASLTKELGMAPGGEFRAAMKEASESVPGCHIALGDRPIQMTIQRALSSLSPWQKLKIACSIIFSKDTITQEEVEKCKEKDMLEAMMQEIAGEYGDLARVFVDERDLFLSYSLEKAAKGGRHPFFPALKTPFNRVVGVVGIGHVAGIKKYWEKVTNEQVKEVMVIPEPHTSEKVIKFVVKCAFYGTLFYGGYKLLRRPVSNILSSI